MTVGIRAVAAEHCFVTLETLNNVVVVSSSTVTCGDVGLGAGEVWG